LKWWWDLQKVKQTGQQSDLGIAHPRRPRRASKKGLVEIEKRNLEKQLCTRP
jgi:hypothetical protein